MGSLVNRVHKVLATQFGRRLRVARSSARISFTFDDFPKSAIDIAGGMLAAEGVRGTYYAALGLMGTTTSVGAIFTRPDLDVLVEAGHELACHTFHHLSARRVPVGSLRDDCARNRGTASQMLGGCLLRNFSFPYGDVTLAAKRGLSTQYESCRTVEPGLNRNPADVAFLRANPIYSWRPLADLKALIDQNSREKGWLIFYTHDVVPFPSEFGCTPEEFRQVLSWAAASGAELLTIAQALGLSEA